METNHHGTIKIVKMLEDGKRQYRVAVRQRRNLSSVRVNNQVIAWKITSKMIHWMLRAGFLTFLSFSALLYVSITFIFALIIMAVAQVQPRCVTNTIFEDEFDFSAGLNDAWQLSWTTFSTVGYGGISPATSAQFLETMDEFRSDGSCALMSFVLSFECLVGILAVSFAGAIIYGKLMQFQCDAKVKFSSVMVVKFGDGLLPNPSDSARLFSSPSQDSSRSLESLPENRNIVPCPILIFRIVNLLHDNRFGDVISAQVKSVATVKKDHAINQRQTHNAQFSNALQSTRNLMEGSNSMMSFAPTQFKRQMVFLSQKKDPNNVDKSPSTQSVSIESSSTVTRASDGSIIKKIQHFVASKRKETDELESVETRGETGKMMNPVIVCQEKEIEMPNLVFEKVSLEPDNHPCFNTSWRLVHTLDENSPLLTKEVRSKIKNLGGSWPLDMNNTDDVRDSIDFDQFLVSFQGLSKATGTDIYAQKVYRLDDLKVGYQFRSILHAQPNGSIGVLSDRINDITHQ